MSAKIGKRLEKCVRFTLSNTKETNRNGVPIGIIEGYASTYDIDRGDDIILPGAFSKTIERHKKDNRPVRMLLQHKNGILIGGFPISEVKETDEGLFVSGEINLEVQNGRESYALAKQGVLSDMSIGFSIPNREAVEFKNDGERVLRLIKEVELWEISLVDEPMNPQARITAVKANAPYADLPLADRSTPWDVKAALERVRVITGSVDAPSDTYKNAFLWHDTKKPDSFDSYKLLIADVIDDALCVVPRGTFSAASVLLGARTSVGVPDDDHPEVMANIEKYYRKLDLDSPFSKSFGIDSTLCEACENIAEVEELLKMLGLSGEGRKILISRIKSTTAREEPGVKTQEPDGREDQSDKDRISKALGAIGDNIQRMRVESALHRMTNPQ